MLDYVDPNTGEVTQVSSNKYWLLLILRESESLRMRELKRKTGFNNRTIRMYLEELSEEYNIRHIGNFPNVSYSLVG